MIPSRGEWTAALEKRHGKSLQQKFSAATVAICGLGGLGSNVAVALARAGVGRLILIDFLQEASKGCLLIFICNKTHGELARQAERKRPLRP